MAFVLRYSALMTAGLILAVAATFIDPVTLRFATPDAAGVAAFPYVTFAPGLALGIALGMTGSIRQATWQRWGLKARHYLAEAAGFALVAATAVAIFYYA